MKKFGKLVIVPALALIAAGGVTIAAEAACLSNGEVQQAVASGKIMTLDRVLADNGLSQNNLVAIPSVCEQGGALYYELSVLDSNGNARKLELNASPGAS